jgi:hypothetical protein
VSVRLSSQALSLVSKQGSLAAVPGASATENRATGKSTSAKLTLRVPRRR